MQSASIDLSRHYTHGQRGREATEAEYSLLIVAAIEKCCKMILWASFSVFRTLP